MIKATFEQLVLVVWTFSITILDLCRYEGDTGVFTLIVATIITAIIYYLIGLLILTIINGIHLLIRKLTIKRNIRRK